MATQYKCILFDCDGVLVDSEAITNTVLVEMAAEVGLLLDKTFTEKAFLGKSLNYIFQYFESQIKHPLPENFEQDFRARTFERFKTDIKPIAGIHDLLNKIEVPYCVASSGPLSKIELNLKITGLFEKFKGRMFSCYDIGKWKPDPAIFLHAAQQMGFSPAECVVVEDSVSGVQAAKGGGFKVYGFAKGNAIELSNAGAITFTSMEELYGLLQQQ